MVGLNLEPCSYKASFITTQPWETTLNMFSFIRPLLYVAAQPDQFCNENFSCKILSLYKIKAPRVLHKPLKRFSCCQLCLINFTIKTHLTDLVHSLKQRESPIHRMEFCLFVFFTFLLFSRDRKEQHL